MQTIRGWFQDAPIILCKIDYQWGVTVIIPVLKCNLQINSSGSFILIYWRKFWIQNWNIPAMNWSLSQNWLGQFPLFVFCLLLKIDVGGTFDFRPWVYLKCSNPLYNIFHKITVLISFLWLYSDSILTRTF